MLLEGPPARCKQHQPNVSFTPSLLPLPFPCSPRGDSQAIERCIDTTCPGYSVNRSSLVTILRRHKPKALIAGSKGEESGGRHTYTLGVGSVLSAKRAICKHRVHQTSEIDWHIPSAVFSGSRLAKDGTAPPMLVLEPNAPALLRRATTTPGRNTNEVHTIYYFLPTKLSTANTSSAICVFQCLAVFQRLTC